MTDKRPVLPEIKWTWYSLCSAHHEYDETCARCNVGRWISDNETELSNWLWTYSPRIWRKWANRDSVYGWINYLRKCFKDKL